MPIKTPINKSYSANSLVFSNGYNGADYVCNKISMFDGGNTPTTSRQYGFGVSSYTTAYFSSQYQRFRYGLSIGGTNFGNVGMELNNNNLSVGGAISSGSSIYAKTTIQSSGTYCFPNNIWNNTNDGYLMWIITSGCFLI